MTSQLPWLRVSYSSLNTFEYCARKFEFGKIYGQYKERVDDESIPAEAGKAFHQGYQTYIATQNRELAEWELLRAYPWALDAASDRNTRGWDVTLSTFHEACDRFSLGEFELMQFQHPTKGLIPCVELPFELRFLGTELPGYAGIAFIGYIDLILRSKYRKVVRTTDIKTHQSRMRDRTAEYLYNTQQVPYGIVVEHLLGNPVENFEVMYLDCFLDLAEPKVTDYTYTKDTTSIQEWLTAKVMQFSSIKQMQEMGLFTRRENGCTAFQYPCKFLDICASRNKDNITRWFDGIKDIQDTWSPWVVAELDLGISL